MSRAKKCATRRCKDTVTEYNREGDCVETDMCLDCYEADRAGDMADREYDRVRDERAVRA